MSNQRMAGSEPVLPLLLAAAGALPNLSADEQALARRQLGKFDPDLVTALVAALADGRLVG